MRRFLAAVVAVAAITAALASGTIQPSNAAQARPEAAGTAARGNTYAILFVKITGADARAVWIAGKRAELRSGYWTVWVTGPQRDRTRRLVRVSTPRETWWELVPFVNVRDW